MAAACKVRQTHPATHPPTPPTNPPSTIACPQPTKVHAPAARLSWVVSPGSAPDRSAYTKRRVPYRDDCTEAGQRCAIAAAAAAAAASGQHHPPQSPPTLPLQCCPSIHSDIAGQHPAANTQHQPQRHTCLLRQEGAHQHGQVVTSITAPLVGSCLGVTLRRRRRWRCRPPPGLVLRGRSVTRAEIAVSRAV